MQVGPKGRFHNNIPRSWASGHPQTGERKGNADENLGADVTRPQDSNGLESTSCDVHASAEPISLDDLPIASIVCYWPTVPAGFAMLVIATIQCVRRRRNGQPADHEANGSERLEMIIGKCGSFGDDTLPSEGDKHSFSSARDGHGEIIRLLGEDECAAGSSNLMRRPE